MKDNESIRNDYLSAIKIFENKVGEIDKKHNTFAKIEIDSDTIYQIGNEFPAAYLRDIKLKEILIK